MLRAENADIHLIDALTLAIQDERDAAYDLIEVINGLYPSPLKLLLRWLHSATVPALLYLLHPCSRRSPQSPTT